MVFVHHAEGSRPSCSSVVVLSMALVGVVLHKLPYLNALYAGNLEGKGEVQKARNNVGSRYVRRAKHVLWKGELPNGDPAEQ